MNLYVFYDSSMWPLGRYLISVGTMTGWGGERGGLCGCVADQ